MNFLQPFSDSLITKQNLQTHRKKSKHIVRHCQLIQKEWNNDCPHQQNVALNVRPFSVWTVLGIIALASMKFQSVSKNSTGEVRAKSEEVLLICHQGSRVDNVGPRHSFGLLMSSFLPPVALIAEVMMAIYEGKFLLFARHKCLP